jgi:ribosomal protein S18 acetylase RimI-like enzyme
VVDSDRAVARRVLEIQHAAYAVEAGLVGYDTIPPLHETVVELQSQPLTFLGVSCDRTLAGVLGYRRQGDTVDIDRLAVHPTFFRRGLATKLLRELLARERDARHFTVSTGLGNHPAINVYERFGFRVVGDNEPVPGVRIVLLQRDQQPTRSGETSSGGGDRDQP